MNFTHLIKRRLKRQEKNYLKENTIQDLRRVSVNIVDLYLYIQVN